MPKNKTLTVEDLWRIERVGSLSAAPDGSRLVCALTRYSMEDNQSTTQLWLLPTGGRAAPRLLTTAGTRNGAPAWSPRGDRIAFLGKREQQGVKDETPQLYLISPDGGEATRAATFAPGIESFRWTPDGRGIVFAAWAWPELRGVQAQEKRYCEFTRRKETGYATSEADYRYWDHHHPMGRVVHLFHLQLASGRITDLFEGSRYELQRDELAPQPFDVSPDSKRVAFVFDPLARKVAGQPRAVAEIELKTRRVRELLRDAQWDFDTPRYAPGGERLALLAAHRGRKHTMPYKPAVLVLGGGKARWRALGADWDLEAGSAPMWSPDGRSLLVSAEARGRCHLWRAEVEADRFAIDTEGGSVLAFDVAGAPGAESEVVVTAVDGHSHPARVYARHGVAGTPQRLDRFNDALLSRLSLGKVEEVSFTGALKQQVQMWVTYPVNFDPRRKHPVLQVIHGGPYTAAGDSFIYRWNAHLLASQGHVVAQINYHGSSGFGYAWKDSLIGRLAELELQDVEAGTDWLLKQPWADRERVFASGGSYGGFMVAWMNGHVKPGRYRAYVCHAGVYDRVTTFAADSYPQRPKDMAADYWDDMKKVLAQSPHASAGRMQTPTLVIHGALDYRVPDANGLAYYNMLQARGVDARLLWFPDENHWILKPRNSRQWYGEFFGWLERHGGKRDSSARTRR